CDGKRFRPEVLEVRRDGLSVSDVLALTVSEALEAFRDEPRVSGLLRPLFDVGLGYLRLGQPPSPPSGGDAPRPRVPGARPAPPAGRKPNLYALDEPTTGLHLDDVAVLLEALSRLVDRGHGVLAVEHHLDFVAAADHVVDLGPEGGPEGGAIVAEGTPE